MPACPVAGAGRGRARASGIVRSPAHSYMSSPFDPRFRRLCLDIRAVAGGAASRRLRRCRHLRFRRLCCRPDVRAFARSLRRRCLLVAAVAGAAAAVAGAAAAVAGAAAAAAAATAAPAAPPPAAPASAAPVPVAPPPAARAPGCPCACCPCTCCPCASVLARRKILSLFNRPKRENLQGPTSLHPAAKSAQNLYLRPELGLQEPNKHILDMFVGFLQVQLGFGRRHILCRFGCRVQRHLLDLQGPNKTNLHPAAPEIHKNRRGFALLHTVPVCTHTPDSRLCTARQASFTRHTLPHPPQTAQAHSSSTTSR